MLEEKILLSFKKKLGKEVEGLNLIVTFDPENWEEDYSCEVMEKQNNGKVWTVKCTKTGNVKEYYEL